jgi:hypothetical protein
MEMETDSSVADLRPDGRYRVGEQREHRVSKRGRLGEGRPTKRTPEVVAKIAHDGSSPLKAMIPQRLLSEQDPTFVA